MPQVGSAFGALDLNTLHAVGKILLLGDHLIAYRLKIAGPATTGVVLGVGVEQGLTTAGTVVNTRHLAVVILTAKRAFGATQATDMVLRLGKLFAPDIQGFIDLFHKGFLSSRKMVDRYLFQAPGHTYHACISRRRPYAR